MVKILDCTLRDGGYYNNWDFDKKTVDAYIDSTRNLPIDYLEIGYRNLPENDYLGKYAYCPVYELEDIREKTTKKLAIMLNEKSVRPNNLAKLTSPIKDLINMVRLAIDPQNFKRALELAKALKEQGFDVGFNVMYMSKWLEYDGFIDGLGQVNEVADVFCLVDSYGGVNPAYVDSIIKEVKRRVNIPIGFHGHNNLELGLANALVAIDNKVDVIDATILGMGRGAGNLKTELLLTYLSKHFDLEVDLNSLGKAVSAFNPLLEKYQWGTNLPYMISGAHSFPQKDVMDMVSNRLYSFNSIVRVLDNKKANIQDNIKLSNFEGFIAENVLIVGGGDNAKLHIDGIKEFVKTVKDLTIVHASSRNASFYQNIDKSQIFCLVGNEGERLQKMFDGEFSSFVGRCILPPFPRKMGTEIPTSLSDKAYELKTVNFTDMFQDSCTTLALQTALELEAKNIYIVGYDGYPDEIMTNKEKDLTHENEYILMKFCNFFEGKVVSLTPTVYDLSVESLYQNL